MPDCLKCARCCYLAPNKPCKFLNTDTKLCKVYMSRFRRMTGYYKHQKQYCKLREDVKFNYLGCPYNEKNNKFRDVGY